MAFNTYADLQTSIANWLARDDLTAYIPDFITIFEAAACRRLRVRLEETTTTLTPTSGVATLPTDYLGHRRVTWLGSPVRDLTYVVPTIFSSDYPTQPVGAPSEFTIEGSSLKVMPSSDTSIEFLYYQKTAAVSGTLNWLFTRHPDAYLFGSLCEANMFNKGNAIPLAANWKDRRDEVFNEIQALDFNERSNMSMRVVGNTP